MPGKVDESPMDRRVGGRQRKVPSMEDFQVDTPKRISRTMDQSTDSKLKNSWQRKSKRSSVTDKTSGDIRSYFKVNSSPACFENKQNDTPKSSDCDKIDLNSNGSSSISNQLNSARELGDHQVDGSVTTKARTRRSVTKDSSQDNIGGSVKPIEAKKENINETILMSPPKRLSMRMQRRSNGNGCGQIVNQATMHEVNSKLNGSQPVDNSAPAVESSTTSHEVSPSTERRLSIRLRKPPVSLEEYQVTNSVIKSASSKEEKQSAKKDNEMINSTCSKGRQDSDTASNDDVETVNVKSKSQLHDSRGKKSQRLSKNVSDSDTASNDDVETVNVKSKSQLHDSGGKKSQRLSKNISESVMEENSTSDVHVDVSSNDNEHCGSERRLSSRPKKITNKLQEFLKGKKCHDDNKFKEKSSSVDESSMKNNSEKDTDLSCEVSTVSSEEISSEQRRLSVRTRKVTSKMEDFVAMSPKEKDIRQIDSSCESPPKTTNSPSNKQFSQSKTPSTETKKLIVLLDKREVTNMKRKLDLNTETEKVNGNLLMKKRRRLRRSMESGEYDIGDAESDTDVDKKSKCNENTVKSVDIINQDLNCSLETVAPKRGRGRPPKTSIENSEKNTPSGVRSSSRINATTDCDSPIRQSPQKSSTKVDQSPEAVDDDRRLSGRQRKIPVHMEGFILGSGRKQKGELKDSDQDPDQKQAKVGQVQQKKDRDRYMGSSLDGAKFEAAGLVDALPYVRLEACKFPYTGPTQDTDSDSSSDESSGTSEDEEEIDVDTCESSPPKKRRGRPRLYPEGFKAHHAKHKTPREKKEKKSPKSAKKRSYELSEDTPKIKRKVGRPRKEESDRMKRERCDGSSDEDNVRRSNRERKKRKLEDYNTDTLDSDLSENGTPGRFKYSSSIRNKALSKALLKSSLRGMPLCQRSALGSSSWMKERGIFPLSSSALAAGEGRHTEKADRVFWEQHQRQFEHDIRRFMASHGKHVGKTPMWHGKQLNMFQLYCIIYEHGGADQVSADKRWLSIYKDIWPQAIGKVQTAHGLKSFYQRNMLAYEQWLSGEDYREALEDATDIKDVKSSKLRKLLDDIAGSDAEEMLDNDVMDYQEDPFETTAYDLYDRDDNVSETSSTQELLAELEVQASQASAYDILVEKVQKESSKMKLDVVFHDERAKGESNYTEANTAAEFGVYTEANTAAEFEAPNVTEDYIDGASQLVPNYECFNDMSSQVTDDEVFHEMQALGEQLEILEQAGADAPLEQLVDLLPDPGDGGGGAMQLQDLQQLDPYSLLSGVEEEQDMDEDAWLMLHAQLDQEVENEDDGEEEQEE